MISFILKSKNINRASYLWNAVSGMLNSVQSPMLLLLVARGTNGVNDSAVFVIAYAIANLMMMIGKYGVRNFQVTDAINKYNFSDYLFARKITTIIMIVSSFCYVVANGYSFEKMCIVLLVCILKVFDSYEDVYHSQLQKIGRLDVAGKILSIRLIYYFVSFSVVYILCDNLLTACIISVLSSILVGVVLDVIAWKEFDIECKKHDKKNVIQILKSCFPLFLCSYLIMYIANAPKYIVDEFYSTDIQAAFNYVFMPVFVIALFGNFIFQPMQTKAAKIYKEGEYKKFNSLIIKGTIEVLIITLVIAFIGYLFGIPVMSIVFNYDLLSYRKELVILLITGGGLALINMINIFISLIRYQKHMIISYCLLAVITKVVGDIVAGKYSVLTLIEFYCMVVYLLMIILMIVLVLGIKKGKKQGNIGG